MPDVGVADGLIWISDHHPHAQDLCQIGERASDRAVANDADAAVSKLPSHPDLRLSARVVIGGDVRNTARKVDHETDCEFSNCLYEAWRGVCHQNADP